MAAKKLRRTRRKLRGQTTASRPMPTSMQLLVNRLSLIGDLITTVELALRAQNADHDAAFAMTLRRCAADPIYAARDEVEQLAMRLSAGT